MQHLDEGTIHAWLDGELPPDDAESAARHVAGCAECRALVVEARGLLAGASRIVSALTCDISTNIPSRFISRTVFLPNSVSPLCSTRSVAASAQSMLSQCVSVM